MTPEKRIQNAIVKYLNDLAKAGMPVFVERRNAGGFSYKKGIPDLYAVVDGMHLEIEVKTLDGELEPLQEKYRLKCERLRIPWVCATCVEDVQEIVEKRLIKRFLEDKIW